MTLSVMLLVVLGACKPNPNTPTGGTATPAYIVQLMPHKLDCRYVTTVQPGPTWNGLTIGVSTLQDVQATFAPVEGSWTDIGEYLEFNKPISSINDSEPDLWHGASACFIDDRLSALAVFPGLDAEYSMSVDDWVEAKGNPDRVTWGIPIDSRSLIWAEEGLLVVLSYTGQALGIKTTRVIIFSPIQESELANSWLMEALPAEKWEHMENTGLGEAEDPWGIEK